MSQISDKYDLTYTVNRELSWLKFNERVLSEAEDKKVPLLERLRFLDIFSSNLDEFFMVRVGYLSDLKIFAPNYRENKSGKTSEQQLENIYDSVKNLIQRRDYIYKSLSAELTENGICDMSIELLDESERKIVDNYYHKQIKPLLTVQIIDKNHSFPHLKNKLLYAAALLSDGKKNFLGIVGLPENTDSVIRLGKSGYKFIRTENVLLHYLKKIFTAYSVREQAVISVTRNADLCFDETQNDTSYDMLTHITKLLKKREYLAPVRLEMQGCAENLRKHLLSYLKLNTRQCYVFESPISFHYLKNIETVNQNLLYPLYKPDESLFAKKKMSIWRQIQKNDVLLFFPYNSMSLFLDLLKEAVYDNNILSVQITLYRLAENSMVIKYLCDAAKNGKSVTVIIELRARFDERHNIFIARQLEESGCKVIFGSKKYKCHAKICLMTRKENHGFSYITQVGTGNYNERTAEIYTDFSLLTADKSIAQDAIDFFHNMLIDNLYGSYKNLLVAPVSLKSSLIKLIEEEKENGSDGSIIIKANSITERELIDKLVSASEAGVKITLIIRGICCIIPEIISKTENISVISIVGRFLEHSRLYCFGKGERSRVFISSADIMTRNQERRIEIACPIYSSRLKLFLESYIDNIFKDSVKSYKLLSNGNYVRRNERGQTEFSVHDYYISNKKAFYNNITENNINFADK